MTTVHLDESRPDARRSVEIAGSRWPLFKLEALAMGLTVLAVLLGLTGSAQLAVLAAAAVGMVHWVLGATGTRSATRTG